MTISQKRKLILLQLDEYLTILDKSLVALEYSYDKCNAIGEKIEKCHKQCQRIL